MNPFPSILIILFSSLTGLSSETSEDSIHIQFIPEIKNIIPEETSAKIIITVPENLSVPRSALSITLHSPDPGPFFTTEYPIVENTELISSSLTSSERKFEFEYIFPIRGIYRMKLNFNPNCVNCRNMAKTLVFQINENPSDKFHFTIFSAFLLAAGSIAGWIFTGRVRTKK